MKRGKIYNLNTGLMKTGTAISAGRIHAAIIGKFMNMRLVNARSRRGMELVQVGILIAIAIALGIIFKDKIQEFINETFEGLLVEKFQ